MQRLNEIIKERILILDGAMGTMIQGFGLNEDDFRGQRFKDTTIQMKGNNDMLCLTRPDIILDIHRKYLAAGADIIETNTFSSQRISQADYKLEDSARDMALAGAKLARQAADEYSSPDKPRFVAGSVGPTNKTCSMSPDVSDPAARELTYDVLYDAYKEQVEALIEGGVDAILIETIFDTLNAKCAIDASLNVMAEKHCQLPIMLSVTVSDLAGRTLSGQTIEAFLASISSYPVFSVGLNCSFGARQMKPFLEQMCQHSPYYISAYPNAGLPNSLGQYDETAASMAPQIAEFIDEGLVNIIGGCCGTTDEFIARYSQLVQGKKPHLPMPKPKNMLLSGLEPLEVRPGMFINVGERCNVAGSRKFLRLIKEKNYEEAMSIARKQVDDGALVIDINMDDGLLDAKSEMVNFLNLMSGILKLAQGRLCCPTLEQVGAAALYRLDKSYYDEAKAEYEGRRNAAYEELSQIPGIVCQKPGGAFYLTCKLPVEDAEDFLMFLLKEFDDNGETVMFAPAAGFYATPGLGKNEMRIAYVLNQESMRRGAELIKLGIEAYKAAGNK